MPLYIPQLRPVTNLPIISNSGDAANWQIAHSTAPMYAGIQLIRTAFFLKLNINTQSASYHTRDPMQYELSTAVSQLYQNKYKVVYDLC